MSVKLLTKHYLEFLSLKGGCTGSSESTLVKMPHCWKSHVAAHFYLLAGQIIVRECNSSIYFAAYSPAKAPPIDIPIR